MANPENTGNRIRGARTKGAKAKAAGLPRESNPYSLPNMSLAWFEGFDAEGGE